MNVNLVVDTSVVIAVVTHEPSKPVLVRQTQGAMLYAPASLPAEIGNAFSAMLKRGRILLAQAQAAVAASRQIPITLTEIDLEDALALAARLNIYAYDAYVLSCALRLGCLLLTLDGGLKTAAHAAGVPVEEINDDDPDNLS